MYAGELWVKLRTFDEIYLATHVYYYCVLGSEVMFGYCYYNSILRSDRLCLASVFDS